MKCSRLQQINKYNNKKNKYNFKKTTTTTKNRKGDVVEGKCRYLKTCRSGTDTRTQRNQPPRLDPLNRRFPVQVFFHWLTHIPGIPISHTIETADFLSLMESPSQILAELLYLNPNHSSYFFLFDPNSIYIELLDNFHLSFFFLRLFNLNCKILGHN